MDSKPLLFVMSSFDTIIEPAINKNIDELILRFQQYKKYYNVRYFSQDINNYSKVLGVIHYPCSRHYYYLLNHLEYLFISFCIIFKYRKTNPTILVYGVGCPQVLLFRLIGINNIIVVLHYNWYKQVKDINKGQFFGIFAFLIQYITLIGSNRIISLSNYLLSILDEMKINKKHIIIPNSIDTEQFRPLPKNTEIINTLHLGGYTILLFVGRIHPVKRLEDLLIVMNNLREEKIILIIIGDGPLKSELYTRYNNPHILFLGELNRKEIIKYYTTADLFILPSQYEGQPRVIIEAFSCKLPVIASDVEGNNSLISDGETGFLFKVEDISKIQSLILDFIKDKKKYSDMAENAYNKIQKEYIFKTNIIAEIGYLKIVP